MVANNSMNRQRMLLGGNSYEKELRFGVFAYLEECLRRYGQVAWLDICCGEGRALWEASMAFSGHPLHHAIQLVGVDLVDSFVPPPKHRDIDSPEVSFVVSPIREWRANRTFDLITCVHGMHYIGDKLGLLQRCASWLCPDGMFLGHLERASIRSEKGTSLARRLTTLFVDNGVDYDPRYRLIRMEGECDFVCSWEYVGARDDAGPNYTGQPAVHSVYRVK